MKTAVSSTLVMLLLAACGGVEVKDNIINTYYEGGTSEDDGGSVSDAPVDDDEDSDNDSNADDDGLIRLTTNQIYEVDTLIKALDVNYEDSGYSTVRVTDGPYAGLEIQKQPSTREADLVSIKFANAGQATRIGYASDDIHTILAAFVNTIGSQPSQPQVTNETINDQTVQIVKLYDKENGAFSLSNSSLQIRLQSGETLSSTAGTATDGSDLGRYIGFERISPNVFAMPSGTANFTGRTVIFSDNPNILYTSNTATLALDFDTVSGEFRADNFTPDNPADSPKTIEIEANLTMDATEGTFQALNGTFAVDGISTSDVKVNGLLATDASAAAGYIAPSQEVDDIIGGLFLLPQDRE